MTFLRQVSSGTEPILRRPQNFNSVIEVQHISKREERSATSATEGRRTQAICEVEESTMFLTSDLWMTARVCKTPGLQSLLGEGYMCVQDHQNLSFSGISAFVPSSCSLWAVDSLRAELSPLAVVDLRLQELELSSGLQIVAEHRFCKSVGENNGIHRLGGREYSCHQQHLALKTDPVSYTFLPSGCVCYHLERRRTSGGSSLFLFGGRFLSWLFILLLIHRLGL